MDRYRASLNDPENFIGRVEYAAAVIAAGSTTSREFDTCFENGDQVAVAAALMRLAATNPRLAENMFLYIVEDLARAAETELQGCDLADAARKLRAAATARMDAATSDLSKQIAEAAEHTR